MKKRVFSWLLVSLVLLSLATSCGKKETAKPAPAPVEEKPTVVTSLAEAKAAVEAGEYEAAYLYLLTDTSEEARELKQKFVYVPVEVSQSEDGETYATGRWEYDAKGYPILQDTNAKHVFDKGSAVDVAAQVECTYDDEGRLLTQTITKTRNGTESWGKETNTYDAGGNCLTYDISHSDGTWEKGAYTYDADGHPLTCHITRYDDTWQKTTYTYDAAGNELTRYETNSIDYWKKYESTYDDAGHLLTRYTTNWKDEWTKHVYTYDAAGNLLTEEETDYRDMVKKYTYSAQKDKKGNPILLYSYEKFYGSVLGEDGNRIEKADWTEKESTYDVNGNPLTAREYSYNYRHPVDSSGKYTVYTYDDKGNCLGREQYQYSDYADWEESVTHRDSSRFTYTYDEAGRILTKKEIRDYSYGGQGYDNYTYTYNADGTYVVKKTVYLADEWQHTVTTTYDAEERILVRETVESGGAWERETYIYRVNGYVHRTERYDEYEYHDGSYRKCTFDAAGNCLTEEEFASGVLTTAVYTYDAAGNRLTEEKTNGDGEVTRYEYTYDQYGNRLSEKYTGADGAWIKTVTDAAGNVLSREDSSGFQTTIRWELRYYPDGVAHDAYWALEGCEQAAKSFLQDIYDSTWDMYL
ncbi:MAG: RHS repeat protein [Clostridia bacterium]|nr:RHS repeat protein [Clostridia bacterium]